MAGVERIEAGRVVLRRVRADDVAALHAIFSDPLVMRYWSRTPHTDLAETEEWVRSMIEADPALSDDFVIEADGACVGKMGAWRLPEFGFLLARERWGQGIASEALAAFIAHRRSIAPRTRLEADVDPRNAASLRLLARHGFAETGRAQATWVVGGETCDSVYLALAL